MSSAEFDEHAQSYDDLHRRNIALTGEEPAYFADYKMRDFRHLVDRAGLPADGQYLDFGCGIGAAAAPFRAHLPDARLTGADVSASSLELARQSAGDASAYALIDDADGRLPFDDGSFDGAFACCVFHHIAHERHVAVLCDIKRVLRPGGLLMVYEHNPLNPLTVRAVRTCPFDENARLIGAGRMAARVREAGFSATERDFRVFFPSSLAALRPAEDRLRWLPLGAQYFVAARA